MYAINETTKNPIFQINQHIGFDKDVLDDNGVVVEQGDGQGIDGIVFSNEVLSYNDADVQELLFYVNSQGGDVQRSLDMFNAIAMSKQKTHAIITGFAFSCAGWIPLAADKVDMVEETGRWMCHMPYNPDNPEEKSQFMDEVVDIISNTIASKSGRNGKPKKTQSEVKKLMREKTYWDAQRMYDEGLIDNKVTASGKVIRFEKDPITLNKTELNFYYKENQTALNKLIAEKKDQTEQIKIQIKMAYPKVVNRLNAISKDKTGISFNLTEDSSEEVILDAITRLENRLRFMNDDMMDKEKIVLDAHKEGEDLKNKMETAKKVADDKEKEAKDAMCEYNKMKEAHDKMEVENKAMKSEKEEAENKAKAENLKMRQERAKNYIDSLEKEGKIKETQFMKIEDLKAHLVNKATENYEDVVSQFSSIVGDKEKIKAVKIGMSKVKNEGADSVNIMEKLKVSNATKIKTKWNDFRTASGITTDLYEIESAKN